MALQLNNNYDPFMRTQNPAFTMENVHIRLIVYPA